MHDWLHPESLKREGGAATAGCGPKSQGPAGSGGGRWQCLPRKQVVWGVVVFSHRPGAERPALSVLQAASPP